MGPMAGFPPPMLKFLEESSHILNPEQFTVLTKYLAERRTALRPEPGGPGSRMVEGMAHRAERWLDLSPEQRTRFDASVSARGDQLRELYRDLDDGKIGLDAARDKIKSIRADGEKEVQAILSADQWKQLQDARARMRSHHFRPPVAAMDRNAGLRVDFAMRVLNLTSAQVAQVRDIQDAALAKRKEALQKGADAKSEPEDVMLDLWKIEQESMGKVRDTLNKEQTQRFDALLLLLPGRLRK
jgi:Spy/CpxP family protein refolding chaperone